MANLRLNREGYVSTFQIASGSSTHSLTLPDTYRDIDLSKSFVYCTWRSANVAVGAANWDRMLLSYELVNVGGAIRVDFRRVGTGAALDVTCTVLEFASGLTVQRGKNSVTLNQTNVTITSVDLSKSILLATWSCTATSAGTSEGMRSRFNSDTQINFRFGNTGGPANAQITWQVLTFDSDVLCQQIEGTIANGSTNASLTATSHSPRNTLYFPSWRLSNTNSSAISSYFMGVSVSSGGYPTDETTSIRVDRSGTSQAFDINIQAITFLDDDVFIDPLPAANITTGFTTSNEFLEYEPSFRGKKERTLSIISGYQYTSSYGAEGTDLGDAFINATTSSLVTDGVRYQRAFNTSGTAASITGANALFRMKKNTQRPVVRRIIRDEVQSGDSTGTVVYYNLPSDLNLDKSVLFYNYRVDTGSSATGPEDHSNVTLICYLECTTDTGVKRLVLRRPQNVLPDSHIITVSFQIVEYKKGVRVYRRALLNTGSGIDTDNFSTIITSQSTGYTTANGGKGVSSLIPWQIQEPENVLILGSSSWGNTVDGNNVDGTAHMSFGLNHTANTVECYHGEVSTVTGVVSAEFQVVEFTTGGISNLHLRIRRTASGQYVIKNIPINNRILFSTERVLNSTNSTNNNRSSFVTTDNTSISGINSVVFSGNFANPRFFEIQLVKFEHDMVNRTVVTTSASGITSTQTTTIPSTIVPRTLYLLCGTVKSRVVPTGGSFSILNTAVSFDWNTITSTSMDLKLGSAGSPIAAVTQYEIVNIELSSLDPDYPPLSLARNIEIKDITGVLNSVNSVNIPTRLFDPTKTLVFISYRKPSTFTDQHYVMVKKGSDNASIDIENKASGTITGTARILEFSSGVKVQSGTVVMNASDINKFVDIPDIDPGRSILFFTKKADFTTASASSNRSVHAILGKIESSSRLLFTKQIVTADTGSATISWQLAEFTCNASAKQFETDLATGSTSVTISTHDRGLENYITSTPMVAISNAATSTGSDQSFFIQGNVASLANQTKQITRATTGWAFKVCFQELRIQTSELSASTAFVESFLSTDAVKTITPSGPENNTLPLLFSYGGTVSATGEGVGNTHKNFTELKYISPTSVEIRREASGQTANSRGRTYTFNIRPEVNLGPSAGVSFGTFMIL